MKKTVSAVLARSPEPSRGSGDTISHCCCGLPIVREATNVHGLWMCRGVFAGGNGVGHTPNARPTAYHPARDAYGTPLVPHGVVVAVVEEGAS